MRIRHNKKRNTAFVYEALIVEATVALLKKDKERHKKSIQIIKEHFHINQVLAKELRCYQSLYENQNLQTNVSKRILTEAKLQQNSLNSKDIFHKQTALINDINKNLGASVFNNFVPNYKTLATIAQLFSDNISPKNQIILENKIIEKMSGSDNQSEKPEVDKAAYKLFVEKFNSKYESELLPEQKELLTHYISSFSDNAVSLKVFLNEEIDRLKKELIESIKKSEISSDKNMIEKTNAIIEKLNTFSTKGIEENLLLSVLKTQSLVKEISADGDSN
tara:strand:- start:435 stop:1265 length:831 start_codon:yes stop_codon:yes gene_type:complete